MKVGQENMNINSEKGTAIKSNNTAKGIEQGKKK